MVLLVAINHGAHRKHGTRGTRLVGVEESRIGAGDPLSSRKDPKRNDEEKGNNQYETCVLPKSGVSIASTHDGNS